MNPTYTLLEIGILRWLRDNLGRTKGVSLLELGQGASVNIQGDSVDLVEVIQALAVLTKEGLVVSLDEWNPDTNKDRIVGFEITRDGLKALRFVVE